MDIERVQAAGRMRKEFAMLTPSTPIAAPLAPDSTPTARAAAVEANARADLRQQLQAQTRNDAHLADLAATARAAREAASEVPDPMTSLSTIAVAGAMSSVPAALEMMRSIALQSAAGTLSDTDRQTLHTEYAQLTAHVTTTVGRVDAGEPSQASTHDEARQDNAGRQGGDERRGAPAKTAAHQAASQQAGGVQRQRAAPAGRSAQPAPHDDVRAHQLHVGADSYQQVAVRPASAPPPGADATGHPEASHGSVAQAAQFVQVAQAGPGPSVNVVA